MENLVQLNIDTQANAAEVVQELGDKIRVLVNMETCNDNETQTIHWLVDLLARGVTDIASHIRR